MRTCLFAEEVDELIVSGERAINKRVCLKGVLGVVCFCLMRCFCLMSGAGSTLRSSHHNFHSHHSHHPSLSPTGSPPPPTPPLTRPSLCPSLVFGVQLWCGKHRWCMLVLQPAVPSLCLPNCAIPLFPYTLPFLCL